MLFAPGGGQRRPAERQAGMFEKRVHRCPACNWEFQDRLVDGTDVCCSGCGAEYRALVDEESGRATLLRHEDKAIPEPLYLPRGSIRALVALSLAGACWVLVGLARPLPESLLALLLTVLGYYFGFRRNARAAQSSMLDASRQVADPLHLPGGMIRVVLTAGFCISAVALYAQGRLAVEQVLEFYLILAGLLVGHVYRRLTAGGRGTDLIIAVSHVKGLAVLLTTAVLVVAYLGGWQEQWPSGVTGVLAAVVSFYFGSR